MTIYQFLAFALFQLLIMLTTFFFIKKQKKTLKSYVTNSALDIDLDSTFFDIIPTNLFISNDIGQIKFVNKECCKLFEEDQKYLLKKNIFDYISYEFKNPLEKKLDHLNQPLKLQSWLEKKNGKAIYVNLNLVRITLNFLSKEPVYLGIIQDITSSMMKTKQKKEYTEGLENRLTTRNQELVKMNAKLAEKNRELIKVNTSKNIFFANVSHELRTPLVAVCGYVEMLLDDQFGVINEKMRKAFTASNDNLNRLTDFINNLLDLARVESFQDNLNYTNINVGTVCAEIFIRFQSLSNKKNIELINSIVAGTPEVYTDIRHIEQVLSNLISNAIKFTDVGSITVKANETIDNRLKIDVIDTGIGIPDNRKELIFNRFYQAERKNIIQEKGSGLGLSIVKEILNRYNAVVTVKNNIPQGSIFSFSLPTRKKERKISRHTGKVLLVSNNETQNEIISAVTNKVNLTTFIAKTGLAALGMVEKYKYDVIFTDNILSDLEGIELCKMLSDRISQEYTPIYIMTFPVNTSERNKMLLAGARGIITRPFNKKAIKRALNQELETNKQLKET